MKTPLLLLTLTLAIVPQLAGAKAPPVARECKVGVCKKAINHCVKQTCVGLRGRLKSGCVFGQRLTLRGACNLAPDHVGFCNDLASQPCTPDR